jgi:putative ABC transport system permease protein
MPVFRRLARVFRTRRLDQDLEDELRSHIEMRAQDNREAGMSADEARYDAMRRFGNQALIRERTRAAHIAVWLESVQQDIRYGLRALLKSPGFTLVGILVLALGIGANTAIFSVVNAVLLRPLPYKHADQLVVILHHGDDPVAAANYIDWRDQSHSFQTMGAADYWTPNLTGLDPPEHLWALRVTHSLLPALGVEPLRGRLFLPEEEQPGHEHVVILSYRLWKRRFAGEEQVLGQAILLNGEPYTIVGVMPQEFKFAPFWATKAELWAPNVLAGRIHNRSGNSLRVFARLKPEVSLEQARTEMATITARLEQQYPGTNRNVTVTPLKEKVVGDVRPALLVLLGAAGFVLLIACANVTHMTLARAAARQREIAVRTALGARRGRVVRQFLTESLLLAASGATAGLVLAIWGTSVLVKLTPGYIPRVESTAVDAPALVFAIAVTVLTTVLLGVVPAVQASAIQLTDALKQGDRGATESRHRGRLRNLLVASEFSLAFMLLVGAGLMIRSFFALQSIDPGFNPHGVLSMVVSVAGSKEAEPRRREIFYRDLLEKVRKLPGVQYAGAINHLPLAGDIWGWSFEIEGRPQAKPGDGPGAVYRLVMPGYFQSMQIPFERGRDIAPSDALNSPGVVLINEQAANQYWPGEDPIGKRISFENDKITKKPVWLTIIGVVRNAKQSDWQEKPYAEAYLALMQNHDYLENPGSHMAYLTLVVRTAGDPAALAPAVKDAVWLFDRNLPISEVLTMDQVVNDANAQPRFELSLLGIFAVVALLLAAAGIYGVMSYSVSRRTHEIGIRLSLGASRSNVLRLVVSQGMRLALYGAACGVAGALILGRLVGKLLYGVKATDPATFVIVSLTLSSVALISTYLPARRASRVDPMVALRAE